MDKYAQMKRFNHDHRLQAYMYALMYVYPVKIPVEYSFTDTKYFSGNYNKISTPGPVPKHWLGFSYIFLEYY